MQAARAGKKRSYRSDDMEISDADDSGELEDMSDEGSDTDWVPPRKTTKLSSNNSLKSVKSEIPMTEKEETQGSNSRKPLADIGNTAVSTMLLLALSFFVSAACCLA